MSGPDTVDLDDYYHPGEMRTSRSAGGDIADRNSGNIVRVVVDAGKSFWMAAICGICVAITVGTVWHSKERETETQAQIRKLQVHVDEAYDKCTILEKVYEQTQRR